MMVRLIGDKNFAALARHFGHQQPPACGDTANGVRAGELCGRSTAAGSQAVSGRDIACVDWALHRASFAADASPDLASFACLSAEYPATPSLTFSASVWLLASIFPVVSLIDANRLQAADRRATVASAAAFLARGTAENGLVWGEGLRAQVKCSSAAWTCGTR